MFKNVPLLALSGYVILAFVLFATEASASTGSGGGLPWDTWITRVLQSFTGPIAFLFSVIAFIIAGAGLAMGSEFSGFVKAILAACFGVSILVGAQNIVSMVFSGAVVPDGLLVLI